MSLWRERNEEKGAACIHKNSAATAGIEENILSSPRPSRVITHMRCIVRGVYTCEKIMRAKNRSGDEISRYEKKIKKINKHTLQFDQHNFRGRICVFATIDLVRQVWTSCFVTSNKLLIVFAVNNMLY